MQTRTRTLLVAIAITATTVSLAPETSGAEDKSTGTIGFPDGNLLAVGRYTVHLIDPVTGGHQEIATGQSGLHDIVYNPVTNSAFMSNPAPAGNDTILELRWSAATGYQVVPFLSGLREPQGLEVDSAGNLYLAQEGEGSSHIRPRIWKATPGGVVAAVTEYTRGYLWVARYLALSPDESILYASVSPQNHIDDVKLPGGELSRFVGDICFPAGIDVGPDGTVYTTDEPTTGADRLVTITPQGAVSTLLQGPSWIESGMCRGLAFDPRSNTIYVAQGKWLYQVGAAGFWREAFRTPDGSPLHGIDLIPPPGGWPKPTAARTNWMLYP